MLPAPLPSYSRDNEAQTRRQIDDALLQIRSSQQPLVLQASATWNPASVANDAVTAVLVDCQGAAVGDPVTVGFSGNAAGNDLVWSGYVQAANVVRVVLLNKHGSAVDLASGTLTVLVFKRR